MSRFLHRGRGASHNPQNQFETRSVLLDDGEAHARAEVGRRTVFIRDTTRTILSTNKSPDVGFTFSINPYRGCEHGCVYCYARLGHEFLGMSGGLDFESKILVKTAAPLLLEQALSKKSWIPQAIALSGATDPYQPVERRLRLTRKCLRVLAKFRNPVIIITKNHLVTRDIDILAEMASKRLVKVMISITTLKPDLVHRMEPRTSRPLHRIRAIRCLASEGIPTGVLVAPVVPGLTDEEAPSILEAASAAGATSASYIMLRLPGVVEELFSSWARDYYPDRADKIMARIRSLRSGRLSDNRFHHRMTGSGEIARVFRDVFRLSTNRLGLSDNFQLDASQFRQGTTDQRSLFDPDEDLVVNS